jgi:hypothetical protein
VARRNPYIPGLGEFSDNENPWSGGDVDLNAEGTRTTPAGGPLPGFETSPTPDSAKVRLVKDEAVTSAIAGLRSDMRVLQDMNSKFTVMVELAGQTVEQLGQMRREANIKADDMLNAITRMAQGGGASRSGNQGSRPTFVPAAGDATAGYTTLDNISGTFGNPFGIGSPVMNFSNRPDNYSPYVVGANGLATGGASPGSGLALRGGSGLIGPPRGGDGAAMGIGGGPSGGSRGGIGLAVGGGGHGGGLPPYNTGSGPGPGRGPGMPGLGSITQAMPALGSRLAGLATRAAPLALAMQAVQSGFHQYYDQRAQNERFQQIEGGSNAAGFGERAHEEGFRIGHMGLSAADDRAIFEGVTSFGVRGGQRNALANQVYKAKMNQGIGVNESMSALTAAAQFTSSGLESVIAGLREVTTVANQFGENAVQVRRKFVDSLSQIGNNSQISGTAANTLATTLTKSAAAGGRTGLNVNETDYYSGANQSAMIMAGATAGKSYSEMDKLNRNNPQAYAAVLGANTIQTLTSILGDDVVAYIKQELGSNNTQTSSGSEFTRIGNQVLNMMDDKGMPEDLLLQIVQARLPGIQIPTNGFGSWIVRQFSQSGSPAMTKKQSLAGATKVDSHGQIVNENTGKVTGKATGAGGAGGVMTTDDKSQVGISVRHNFKGVVYATGVTNTAIGNLESGKDPAYLKGALKQDKSYAASIDSFGHGAKIPQLEMLGRKYGKNLNKVKVRVHTDSDGDLDMSLEEAIQAYPAVIAAGDADIIAGAGDDNGKSLADIMGGQADTSAGNEKQAAIEKKSKAAARATQFSGAGSKSGAVKDKDTQGKSESWYKQHGLTDYYKNQQKKDRADGTVQVTLTDSASKLLKLLGPDANSNANSGVPGTSSSPTSRSGPHDPSNGG